MTESDWWALCDADPGAFPWPHFADWLEERANPRAHPARQVGARGWAPRFHPYLSCWTWWRGGPADPPGPDDLPPAVFRALTEGPPSDGGEWPDYPSPAAAGRALLDALARAPPGAV